MARRRSRRPRGSARCSRAFRASCSGPYAAEATEAYCDAVTAAAEPLELEAKQAFEGCLVTSTRLGWFSDATRVCERELGQLDPSKWPTAAEVHGAPDRIALITTTEGAP